MGDVGNIGRVIRNGGIGGVRKTGGMGVGAWRCRWG